MGQKQAAATGRDPRRVVAEGDARGPGGPGAPQGGGAVADPTERARALRGCSPPLAPRRRASGRR